jgi:hypothetical protein
MYLPSLSPEAPRGIIPGNPIRAEAMFIDGLAALSDEYPRDRTLFCLGIAEARLAQHGRLDEAIDATRTAINLASAAPTPRIRERLKRLIHSLPEDPYTAELREEFACASATQTSATSFGRQAQRPPTRNA